MPEARPSRSATRILVIDDELFVCRALQRALGRKHVVEVASGGQEGIERILDGPPYDIIFCDLMMPGTDGVQVFEEVQRRSPELSRKMVFMTGGVHGDRARAFVKRPTVRTLQKPFDLDEIYALVAASTAASGAAAD